MFIRERPDPAQKGKIYSINQSKLKGTIKEPVKKARLIEDFGLEADAHGGPGIRQVSLLAIESITKQQECAKVKEKSVTLKAGDFAENITTQGVALAGLNIGDKLNIGAKVVLEVSKIGKECHKYCAVYYKTGDCIMPREGIFAKVVKSGEISIGDDIEVIKNV
ncbi:MAG: MOSC domain-containing protein [Candidatus Omnitrophica bacterium]|nr:MOSC domain-containing protein [Candidatus Omnitrophota bacterium]